MAEEIEKKYLIKGPIPKDISEPKLIKQGYIMIDKGRHLRVRLINGTAIIALKFTNEDIRKEFEYTVPYIDGKQMYERCEFFLEKLRFIIHHDGVKYELDSYPNGLKVVEVEFRTQEDANNFKIPSWLGEEVTKLKEYSNITIAKEKLTFT